MTLAIGPNDSTLMVGDGSPIDPAAKAREFLHTNRDVQNLVTFLGDSLDPAKVRSLQSVDLDCDGQAVHFDIINCSEQEVTMTFETERGLECAIATFSSAYVRAALAALEEYLQEEAELYGDDELEEVRQEALSEADKMESALLALASAPHCILRMNGEVAGIYTSDSCQIIILDEPVLHSGLQGSMTFTSLNKEIASEEIQALSKTLGLPRRKLNGEQVYLDILQGFRSVFEGRENEYNFDEFVDAALLATVCDETCLFDGELDGSTLVDAIHQAEQS